MFTAFSVPGELSVIVSLLLVQGPHAFWKRLYPTQLPSKGDLRSVDCGYPKPRPPRNLREKMSVSRLVAVFTTVPEMQACPPEEIHDSMVRVVGRLLRYETKDSLVWLGHYEPPYLELPVDCSLVQPFPFSQGALFQFIGEVDGSGRTCGGRLTLRALAHRCVEGLDMALYRKALAVRHAREWSFMCQNVHYKLQITVIHTTHATETHQHERKELRSSCLNGCTLPCCLPHNWLVQLLNTSLHHHTKKPTVNLPSTHYSESFTCTFWRMSFTNSTLFLELASFLM